MAQGCGASCETLAVRLLAFVSDWGLIYFFSSAANGFGAPYGLSEGDSKDHFMFAPNTSMQVFRELRFPDALDYVGDGRHRVPSMTAFLVFMKRIRTPSTRMTDLKFFFNRSAA